MQHAACSIQHAASIMQRATHTMHGTEGDTRLVSQVYTPSQEVTMEVEARKCSGSRKSRRSNAVAAKALMFVHKGVPVGDHGCGAGSTTSFNN
jgi:hypothetical protein